jgi:hypothetical protein
VTTPTPADALHGIEATIEQAATAWLDAKRTIASGTRAKRVAEKTLAGLPSGTYGRVTIGTRPSDRVVVDLDAVAAAYAEHGLGEVPTKACQPGMYITLAE